MLKIKSFVIFSSLLFLFGCSKYQRLLKSDDYNAKYEAAIDLYERGKYERALPLLEELTPLFRGTDKAEKIYYYYCYTNYNLDFLYEAAYHFKKFSSTFPNSTYAEETLFMNGYCRYLLCASCKLYQLFKSCKNCISNIHSIIGIYFVFWSKDE